MMIGKILDYILIMATFIISFGITSTIIYGSIDSVKPPITCKHYGLELKASVYDVKKKQVILQCEK